MPPKTRADGPQRALATNRSASYEYHLLRRIEAGLVLEGPEVKSAREGRVNLKEAYAKLQHGELYLFQAHFSPYPHARREEFDPTRPRKLLLHAREIRKLVRELDTSGTTLIPTRMYLKSGRVKVELALARGKKLYDKRQAKMRRDAEREMERAREAGRNS